MFTVVQLVDGIRIPPSSFARGEAPEELQRILTHQIEQKYVNRVLPHVGLVVAVHSIDGQRESYIPPAHMREGAEFDEARGAWIMTAGDTVLDIVKGDEVRFRVMGTSYSVKAEASPPHSAAGNAQHNTTTHSGAHSTGDGKGGNAGGEDPKAGLAAPLPARDGWMVVGSEATSGACAPHHNTSAAFVTTSAQEMGGVLGARAQPLAPLPGLPQGLGLIKRSGEELLCPPSTDTSAIDATKQGGVTLLSKYSATMAVPPALLTNSAGTVGLGGTRATEAAMLIIGNIKEDGMGCVGWWESPETAADTPAASTAAM